ncbi:PREDICTED: uncharacterized protein LOC106745975 isoform X2 [Dinoponera quadriceps]|uniref:Mitochondrial genome maintenance exonuclease 1 n=1 Tax=Dinoponera quadriceps TaxID=609295 RepID=A0A6P3XGI2_DINQU|nr:PREDICTED: uncharacterized protein LOC106745975 isoform X2 [Dinoponera quadriceps]
MRFQCVACDVIAKYTTNNIRIHTSIDKIMIMLRTCNCVLRAPSPDMSNVHRTFVRSYRSSKAERINKLMKEYKSVFGDLLETNKEKNTRLKLERKGKIPKQKRNNSDTEFSWVMKQSRNSVKRIVVSEKQQNKHEDKSRTDWTKSPENFSSVTVEDKRPANRNIEDTFHSESSHSTQKITPEITGQKTLIENNSHDSISSDSNATDIESSAAKRGVLEKFFDIVVKNIQSFSIMGNKREPSAELTEVLSISAKDDLKTIRFPSVTKILMHTMSPESKLALEVWRRRMIIILGQKGFDRYQRELLEDGSSLHACIARSLLGKEYEVSSRIEPVFKSVRSVLENVSEVKAIESHVAHTKLRYKGIVDCVASYRGENYVIDWKKSDKKKLDLKATYDAPIQVAAYIGAINASNLYPFAIKRGLVVIAYTCGDPATVHEVCDDTLQKYWMMWLQRLQQYHVETASNDDNTSNKTLM